MLLNDLDTPFHSYLMVMHWLRVMSGRSEGHELIFFDVRIV
jgi:hypothetical protein